MKQLPPSGTLHYYNPALQFETICSAPPVRKRHQASMTLYMFSMFTSLLARQEVSGSTCQAKGALGWCVFAHCVCAHLWVWGGGGVHACMVSLPLSLSLSVCVCVSFGGRGQTRTCACQTCAGDTVAQMQ